MTVSPPQPSPSPDEGGPVASPRGGLRGQECPPCGCCCLRKQTWPQKTHVCPASLCLSPVARAAGAWPGETVTPHSPLRLGFQFHTHPTPAGSGEMKHTEPYCPPYEPALRRCLHSVPVGSAQEGSVSLIFPTVHPTLAVSPLPSCL